MEILLILLTILITAKIFSELAEQVGMTAILGEVIAGIVLGIVIKYNSETFPMFVGLSTDEVFVAITELGIFFLMLYAGVEIHPMDFIKSSGKALWIALGGMLLPLIMGMGMGWWWLPDSEVKLAQTIFLGVALAVTAIPVAVKVLLDLGRLNSRAGKIIVSAAVLDNILSLILLALLTGIIKTGGFPSLTSLAILVGKILLFFIITSTFGYYLFPILGRRLAKYISIDKFEFSLLLVVAMFFAVLAEVLGMHYIIGAFVAGVIFVRRGVQPKVYSQVRDSMKAITTGFLAPIFFVSIGLHLELSAFTTIPVFVVALLLIATIGKLVGAGLPAYWSGLTRREAMVIGNGMNARGAVELIIANIALREGIFDQPQGVPVIEGMFSAVVIMAILTTMITPIALKILVRKE
jgi:Kef-type K+ transport system membrane component KefB